MKATISTARKLLLSATRLSVAFGVMAIMGPFDAALCAQPTAAPTLTTWPLTFPIGSGPEGSLFVDPNGNLIGTFTESEFQGAGGGAGGVYMLAKTANGYASTLTLIASFNYTNGALPTGAVISNANGNLIGTTAWGGSSGDGTLFEIAKTASGYAQTPAVLYNCQEIDCGEPSGNLLADAQGNLYATAIGSGFANHGTIVEFAKTSEGYASAPTVLHAFNGQDGFYPQSSLIATNNGSLIGTTRFGGAYNDGVVFEIEKQTQGFSSRAVALHNFAGRPDKWPSGGVVADANGNLFGNVSVGGRKGNGAVFELIKIGAGYTFKTIAEFNKSDGDVPTGNLLIDSEGNLFGLTTFGGASDAGVVFEIVKTSTGYEPTPKVIVSFNKTNGALPGLGLIADANGNLFGTTEGGAGYGCFTQAGWIYGCGEVFEVSNSGFAPRAP